VPYRYLKAEMKRHDNLNRGLRTQKPGDLFSAAYAMEGEAGNQKMLYSDT
jgi:hypothetical protein